MVHDGAGPEPGRDHDEVVEKFRPTSGLLSGYVVLALAAGTVALAAATRDLPAPVVWFSLLFGVLAWASMLRPRVWVTRSDLVLRNMLDTVSIPLVAIEQVVVRQVLAVRAGDKRYVSPAVGKSWRQTLKSGRPKPGSEPPAVVPDGLSLAAPVVDPGTASYPEFVEARVHHYAEEARARAGISLMSDEQLALAAGVRRDRAWPEIAALAVTALGFVVSLVV